MKLSLVVPCYNESGNVKKFIEEARENLCGIEYEVVFINDGSTDDTLLRLKEISKEKKDNLLIISFSRNFGKEAGLYAGLEHATGEYVVIIDADLQQPLSVAREMFEFLEENTIYDEVVAYQENRKEGKVITLFKSIFYTMINELSDVPLHKNASDFRCLRRNVVDAILSMTEYHRFSKGIFSWVGFQSYYRPYDVQKRYAGETSWTFSALLNYAAEGMISFSIKPLRAVTFLGISTSVMAILYMIVVVFQKLLFGNNVPGYSTIVVLILLLGGVQLTVLGIIGEYLGKVHLEVKKRPIYIAKEIIRSRK